MKLTSSAVAQAKTQRARAAFIVEVAAVVWPRSFSF